MFPSNNPAFISQDGSGHDAQRKTVQPSVAPRHLAKLEPIIRERTCRVLESLPEGETFDWVDTVSIELTTMMLATLFDFPFEDRRKLTRWSDIVFAIPEPGGRIKTLNEIADDGRRPPPSRRSHRRSSGRDLRPRLDWLRRRVLNRNGSRVYERRDQAVHEASHPAIRVGYGKLMNGTVGPFAIHKDRPNSSSMP